MTEAEFWTIIKRSRRGTGASREKQEANLTRELHKLTPEQLVEFDEWFGGFIRSAYNWDLWGAAFVIGGGCSDDGFWDFRSWLVAQGERVYKAAVDDPETLAEVVDEDTPNRSWLDFRNPATSVWGKKLGKEETELHDFPSTIGSNLGEEPDGEEFGDTKEDLEARYPTLWRKFGW